MYERLKVEGIPTESQSLATFDVYLDSPVGIVQYFAKSVSYREAMKIAELYEDITVEPCF